VLTKESAFTGTAMTGIPRPCELFIALLGLIATAPLLLLSALVVVVASGLPVLFCQQRVGRHGRLFTLYKLRTMTCNAETVQVTATGDERVTSVGRILRRWKLDELPGLWNVLKGDMSLVGPRPEVLRYVDLGSPDWQFILEVRPGLTDPVTVRLRNEEDLLGRVEQDREKFYLQTLQPFKLAGYAEYLRCRSWRRDIKALWTTGFAIARPSNIRPPSLAEVLAYAKQSNAQPYSHDNLRHLNQQNSIISVPGPNLK
jgi:lipopolysaccharide/colanic/teichoic acid biosynthesis glycosyltransferase